MRPKHAEHESSNPLLDGKDCPLGAQTRRPQWQH
jgi:hypothetical protein